jgi:hypothetical protein
MAQSVPGAISFTRYVNITSGVGAGANVAQRQLILRLMTSNDILPPGTYKEFSSATDVGAYFGTNSEEFLRAQFYFGWISKNITTPMLISFGRWVSAAVGSMIFGAEGVYSVGNFTPITSGGFTLTLGGFTHTLTGIDLATATSLGGGSPSVASLVQAAVQAYSAGGTAWTGATVSYDATNNRFDFVSGATGTDVISVAAAPTGTDLAAPLGWLTGAILANGSAQESLTQTMTTTSGLSNNFGSFAFLDTLNTAQVTEVSTWNNGENVSYQYCVPVTAATAAAISTAILPLSGTDLTLAPITTEYPEMVPAMILAATDYTKRNAVQNYMYQLNFDLTPSVTNDADANTYDALRVNYYGQTQNAGNFIQFYQRGLMTGGTTAPVDQNIYGNEQWLKSAMSAAIMTLLLAFAQISANAQGRSQLLAIIQSVINQAVFNGVISVGKILTTAQQLFITQATGDPKAWQQVQTIGYWVDCVIQSYVNPNTGLTEYKAVYTLIYAKNDAIRAVNGTDILI